MRARRPMTTLLAALLGAAVVVAPMTAVAAPAARTEAAAPATGLTDGAWVPVLPVTAWGARTGTLVRAATPVEARLDLGRASRVPAAARSLVVQVTVTGASAEGRLALGAEGAEAVVGFPAGSSATTTLVQVDERRALTVEATVDARVSLAVVGHLTGDGAATPGPGGTRLVAPDLVVDSATGEGGDLPAPGDPSRSRSRAGPGSRRPGRVPCGCRSTAPPRATLDSRSATAATTGRPARRRS